ncbi:DUF4214 domain-containing protein [Azomonas macrocytogenes]|uniref:Ca2+-binding RTX toxin-like protein n=1 Tax=Azomonas macrocytogenes TaxID=69962 RepID=A0A839T3C4_AZOMA|nr:DUF4214 domain-containing protein [Azomonas macrocytogenes]MBB3102465.1 Ca2+-binding RTX toxin-like protein [Azomonas macrocytogenes]
MQYDQPTSATEFTKDLAANTAISDETKSAIDALLGDSESVTISSWDGQSAGTSQANPDVVIAQIASPADESPALFKAAVASSNAVDLNLPDAAVYTAHTWIFDSKADLNIDLIAVDDRVIVGGDGNDSINVFGDANVVVEGGAGNDSITTGGGNDTIVAGVGNDTIDAGAGFDTVQFSGSASDYDFEVKDGVLTATRSVTTSDTVTDGDTTTTTTTTSVDSTTLIKGAEILTFGDGSDTVAIVGDEAHAEVIRLYEVLLDRSADTAGAEFWLEQYDAGVSLHDIANSFLSSAEYQAQGETDNVEFLNSLYQDAFGRQGDYNGVAYWLDQLDQGASRADVAAGFAVSDEAAITIDNVIIVTGQDTTDNGEGTA